MGQLNWTPWPTWYSVNQLHIQVAVCRFGSSVKSRFYQLWDSSYFHKRIRGIRKIVTSSLICQLKLAEIHHDNSHRPFFLVTSTGELPEFDWKKWTSNVCIYRIWTPIGSPIRRSEMVILGKNPKISSKKAMGMSTTQLLQSYIIQWILSQSHKKQLCRTHTTDTNSSSW